jgi:hypothetical protein
MTRDIAARLTTFIGEDVLNDVGVEEGVEIRRLALTIEQVRSYNPPPNPAKITDSRATSYIERFGGSSWELDALDPDILASLVTDEILSIRDDDVWDAAVEEEKRDRARLFKLAEDWESFVGLIKVEDDAQKRREKEASDE